MPIVAAFIVPHPPIIVPEVGRGEEKKTEKTVKSYEEVAEAIYDIKPQTVIITSPHSVMYGDYFHISPRKSARGDLSRFRAPEISFNIDYDTDFVKVLSNIASREGIPAGTLGEEDKSLDHGTTVPLYSITKKYRDFKLVRIGLSGLPFAEHYRLGQCIKEAADKSSDNIVFIASGDLSHKVREEGPYGYAEEGIEFDREVTEAMADGNFLKLMTITPDFAEKAAECGLRSFIIMAGALDRKAVKSRLLSYEGTFGVGYGVASFYVQGDDPGRNFLEKYYQLEDEKINKIRQNEDEYVRLARYSVEYFVKHGRRAAIPDTVPEELLGKRAGVFVSLKKFGDLRGCIGTITPVYRSVAEEIINNAVSACSEDPRFSPVKESELKDLVISVDVLSEAEHIDSPEKLDVKRYGVIVTSGRKRGLLLPDLAGVDSVDQQIDIARRKGGIREGEDYSLERFEVIRHK